MDTWLIIILALVISIISILTIIALANGMNSRLYPAVIILLCLSLLCPFIYPPILPVCLFLLFIFSCIVINNSPIGK